LRDGSPGIILWAIRPMNVSISLRIVIAGLTILLAGNAAAAAADRPLLGDRSPLGEYLIDVWHSENGLPNKAIQAIVQTRDGYLWLGTPGGLLLSDGVRFTFIGRGEPKVDNVHALLEDRQGRLWIGTYGAGLHAYERGRFRSYGLADGLGSMNVRSLFEDRQGRLWVATNEGGVSIREGDRFRTLRVGDGLTNDTVRVVYQAPDGRIWIGTNGRGLNCWDAGRLQAYAVKPGSLSDYDRSGPPSSENVLDLWQGEDGTLWIGTDDGGLWHLARGRIGAFLTQRDLGGSGVRRLLSDASGALWIGGDGGGLHRLLGGRMQTLTSQDGLPNDIVTSLFEDREHNIWVGTRDGLARLKRRTFKTIGKPEGLTNDFVTAVRGSGSGGFWVGTRVGLRFVDRDQAAALPVRPGLPDDMVLSLLEDRSGALWIGMRDGLWRVQRGDISRVPRKYGLSGESVNALAEGTNGDVWAGTSRGVSRISGDTVTAIPEAEGLRNVTAVLAAADGSVWAGAEGAGLARWQGGRWTRYGIRDGLVHASVTSLYSDGDSLWIGTLGGLNRMRGGRLRGYTPANGLPAGYVVSLVDDGRGSLWMGSLTGVSRVEKRLFDEFDAGRVARVTGRTFDKSDGMRSSQCNRVGQPSAWRDGQGRLWFSTLRGLVVVDPAHTPSSAQPPPVTIEEVRVDDGILASGAPAVLPSGRTRFEFHYTALALTDPSKVRFRYKLEGFAPDWVDAGTRRVAYYTSIPPGEYRFRVMASNAEGLWSDGDANFAFTLAAPFYRRSLFWAAVAAAALALAFAFHRLHLRQVKAQFAAVTAERARIAREIHDTLAQGFVGIGVQLETAAKMQSTSAEQAREHLDRARILVRSSLAEARRTVWALRSEALEQHDLAGALAQVARQLSGDHEVKVRVSGQSRRLPVEVENNLLRIGQEALANAARHAHAGEISVDLRFGDGVVRLSVQDDGCGFDVEHAAQAASGHFGLAGIRERVHNLGGELNLLSRPGQGSEVVVEVPVA
jgi:signal transduction histidine kinase/ligand-binding sensor domain-containing protein